MVGLPSQLGYQILNDVCKKPVKLTGCCCAAAVEALWQLQLPVNIRAHISNMVFDQNTYKQVFESADQVYLSSKQVSVAALRVAADLDKTVAAFNPENQPQVAALAKKGGFGTAGGGGKPPKKKNNKNKGQGQNKPRGQKHSSVPDSIAEKLCDRHYRHAGNAWYCLAPDSCPWVNKVSPKD